MLSIAKNALHCSNAETCFQSASLGYWYLYVIEPMKRVKGEQLL